MSSSLNMIKRGKVSGKGSEFSVVLGFQPVKVELFNSDSSGLTTCEKHESMDAKFAKKQVPAGTVTFADNMCQINSDGFLIGSDADLNAAGEEIHFTAYEAKNE